ncbi:MAG TPA: hypothetical protein PKH81_02770 [Treponemataceae bacterium]|nr:hypothetical protein [Treponemataceae bacterium]
MLGFGDMGVFLGYALTLVAMVLCVCYGIRNWNRPREDIASEIMEEATWEANDPELGEGGDK